MYKMETHRKIGKPTAYVMIGVPGSGKSTWIKNNLPEVEVMSRDIIRAEMGLCELGDKIVGDKFQEQEVTEKEYQKMQESCDSGTDFAVDDINTGKYRKQLVDFLRKNNYTIVMVRINTPLEVCQERRKGQIKPEVIERIYKSIIEPTEEECDEIVQAENVD